MRLLNTAVNTTTRNIISETDLRRHLHNPASWTKQSWSKASQHITGKNTLWVIHERLIGTTVRRRWRRWSLRRGRAKHLCWSCFARPRHNIPPSSWWPCASEVAPPARSSPYWQGKASHNAVFSRYWSLVVFSKLVMFPLSASNVGHKTESIVDAFTYIKKELRELYLVRIHLLREQKSRMKAEVRNFSEVFPALSFEGFPNFHLTNLTN